MQQPHELSARNCLPPPRQDPVPRRSHPRRAGAHRALGTQPESHLRAGSRRRAGRRPRIRARWNEGRAAVGRRLRWTACPPPSRENIATRGVPVPLGTAATDLTPASADAPPAARMHEAGAVVLGKTTMPDYRHAVVRPVQLPQLTRNPWDLGKNPAAPAPAPARPPRPAAARCTSAPTSAARCACPRLVRHRHAQAQPGPHSHRPARAGRCAGPMTRTVTDTALMMGVLYSPTRATT